MTGTGSATARPGPGSAAAYCFDRAPQRVYWELTRACDLACRHCRAEARPRPDPQELSPAEGRRLLEALRGFGAPGPRLVLTGGDPLKRADFWELVGQAVAAGFDLAVAPAATPALRPEVMAELRHAGVRAVSLSLDGAEAATHDRLRGVAGCFDRTLAAARAAVAAGLALQINTLVSLETQAGLPAVADLVGELGAARWSLFFLVQVGRGRTLGQLSPGACERRLRWLWRRSRRAPFLVTTTEAPHYRRVVLQALRLGEADPAEMSRAPIRRSFGIRDGNGIMFVTHTGEVTPSGFLPLSAGNVRQTSPVKLYREAPLFRALRRPERLRGRCGRCPFRAICGGSRARAFAAMGDPFGEDPLCAYVPPGTGTRVGAGSPSPGDRLRLP